MLAHRLRRWPSIQPALAQRFVFAGLRASMLVVTAGSVYKPTPTQYLLNVGPAPPVRAGQYPFSPSQYLLVEVHTHSIHCTNAV